MPNSQATLESRIEELTEQLHGLARKVEKLEARLNQSPVLRSPAGDKNKALDEAPGDTSENALAWDGMSSLLQRLATLCFLLVVALVLRTVTDNDLLDKNVGSVIGMAYASLLMAWSWRLYSRRSPLASIFSICGAFLLFTVVVETHRHFGSLPKIPAYLLIALGGAVMAAISHRFKIALPVFVGALGMSIAGVALAFPHPVYLYLMGLLLTANLFGTFANRLQRSTWLRSLLLILTVSMILTWVIRLQFYLSRMSPSKLPVETAGFFPAVAVLAATYLVIALFGIRGRISERVSNFDFFLPSVTVVWAFFACRFVVNSGLGSERLLGLVCVATATGLFAAAFWLTRMEDRDSRGINSFSLAGALLLALSLPLLTGNRLLSLTMISALALGMAFLSRRWSDRGVRAASYLLQFYACGTLVYYLSGTEGTRPSLLGAAASGSLASLALIHYLWARKFCPPKDSGFFNRCDPEDRTAVLLLLAALVGGFFTIRVGIYQGLNAAGADPLMPFFASSQTVLINVSAAVLMCVAFARRNSELRNVAVLVTIIGGAKVFVLDLFSIQGVPVVMSVLSFGVAASLESFALTRWQKIDMLRVSPWPRTPEPKDDSAKKA